MPSQYASIVFQARRGCIAISATFGTFGVKSTYGGERCSPHILKYILYKK